MPRKIDRTISKITSDDGMSWLEHRGYDSTRDGGGELLRFLITLPDHQEPLEGVVLVKNVTVFRAKEYLVSTVPDYEDLDFVRRSEILDQYKHEFGCSFKVHWLMKLSFDIKSMSKQEIRDFGTALCSLYLLRYSNYAQNNADPDFDPSGYYKDTIDFWPVLFPHGYINSDFFFVLSADEVFGQ